MHGSFRDTAAFELRSIKFDMQERELLEYRAERQSPNLTKTILSRKLASSAGRSRDL